MLPFEQEAFMNTNNTKEKIITTAIQKIRYEDIQNFSIRNLVQTLDLTTGSFYKHFKNKKALFLAVSQQVSQSLYENIYPKTYRYEKSPKKALCLLGSSLIDFFIDEPRLADFIFFNPEVIDTYSIYGNTQETFKLLGLTTDLVNKFIAQEQLQLSNKVLFVQIWSFIQGYAILIKNQVVPKEENLIEQTLTEFSKGVSHE